MNASQTDDGRFAEKPTEIPARGLWQMAKRVRSGFKHHQVTLVAGGLTFFFLLSLFPAISACVSIFGLIADPDTIRERLQQFSGTVPAPAIGILQDQIERLAGQSQSSLGGAFVVSVLLSVWSARKGIKALFDAMNTAYEEREDRGLAKKTAISFAFTAATIVVMAVALAAAIFVPLVLHVLPVTVGVRWLATVASFLILATVVVAWLGAVMWVGPDRRGARLAWLAPGAIFTVVGWVIASVLVTLLVSTFDAFGATYGSFTSFIVFLVWIWLQSIVLLTGTELNAQLELQTQEDTTRGDPRPLGSRGAVMADNVKHT